MNLFPRKPIDNDQKVRKIIRTLPKSGSLSYNFKGAKRQGRDEFYRIHE